MAHIERLGEILTKKFGNTRAYCVRNADDKVIAGYPDCSFYIRPHKTGGWLVTNQEPGRGIIYQKYHLATEREACIKFIEMTERSYHLGEYLDEFEKETA